MRDVALLILNWNGAHWLDACLSAATESAACVWVVDNGSSDQSLDLVRARFPHVRVLALEHNYGFGAAYNRAMQVVDAPLVALLNNDTEVQGGWLDHLLSALAAHPRAAAVGSKLLQWRRPDLINHAGGQLTLLGAAFDIGLDALDGPTYDASRPIGCATGAAMLIRRDAFLKVGGFDER